MRVLHDPLRLKISEVLFEAIRGTARSQEIDGSVFSLDFFYHQLVQAPQADLGELAFGCFQIAKAFKKSPAQISSELKIFFEKINWLESVQAAGPYLNFKIKSQELGMLFLLPIERGSYFGAPLLKSMPKAMIEFSQPNTHKELHVGHMRNACLGDSLVRLNRYSGVEVISSTFPGDVGTHVAKCLWYLKYYNQEPFPSSNRGEWLGQIYSKANLKLEDEAKSDKYESNKAQLTEILRQLELKSGEFFDLWKETRTWSIELMNYVYEWAGISFDQWYWESEVDTPSVNYVKQLFSEGKLIKSEGAVGMDLSADNLGFCLLLKSDGTGLYATKDLELAKRKFNDFGIEKSIYVVDTRQALHFKQVFKVLEKLGFAQATNCFHLQYNFVELPDGAMSSRKGNIVPLMRLVHKMEEMVKEKYLSKYQSEWSSDEINQVAKQVAQGAIKYGMLKIDNNKKIVFEMDEWLKIDGDSGPFIQYSAARINSLCRKFSYKNDSIQSSVKDWSGLTHNSERNLIQHLIHFNTVVVQATETYRPSVLCTYLFELAQRFNLFYHDCSIGQAENENLKITRLSLSYCVGQILGKGLELLGIPVPERM